MKRFVLFVCCLLLISLLAAQPFVTNAQSPGGEDDYIPLILGDNILSLLYPSTWTFDEESAAAGSFVFASDLSILTREAGQPYAQGEIVLSLDLLITNQPTNDDDGLEAVLMQFLQRMQRGSDGESLTDFAPTIVGPLPVSEGAPVIARAAYSVPDFSDGMVYLWRITDRVLGLVLVNTASGEIALQEPDVLIFMQSVRFNTTPEDLIAAIQQQGGGP